MVAIPLSTGVPPAINHGAMTMDYLKECGTIEMKDLAIMSEVSMSQIMHELEAMCWTYESELSDIARSFQDIEPIS